MAGDSKYKNAWTRDHTDRISTFVPKGQRDVIRAHAAARGESVNAFIGRAIRETMARDRTADALDTARKREQLDTTS